MTGTPSSLFRIAVFVSAIAFYMWAWRDNPNGAFVDWNPRVSCDGL